MIKKLGFVLAFTFLWVATATAGMIVDTVEQDVLLSGFGDHHQYQHDLNDDGFILGSALSGNLTINMYDDNEGITGWTWLTGHFTIPDGQEGGIVVVEDFDFDTGGLTNGNDDYFSGLEVQALAALNSDGFLDVTVKSLVGDFYVGDSVLQVLTARVPEPGTLALLGLGIVSLITLRRGKA